MYSRVDFEIVGTNLSVNCGIHLLFVQYVVIKT
jgi:hypothetical protein